MEEKMLEIREFTGIGYKPLIDYGTWRVAILRYIDELIPDQIERVERHNETDEVFVLLFGQALLFIGEGETKIEKLHSVVMEPGKMYNVKRSVWHTSVLSHDASILLVENRDTGIENTDYAPLSPELRRMLVETSRREQPQSWGQVPKNAELS
jgi:ureidoglycolate hydrolase